MNIFHITGAARGLIGAVLYPRLPRNSQSPGREASRLIGIYTIRGTETILIPPKKKSDRGDAANSDGCTASMCSICQVGELVLRNTEITESRLLHCCSTKKRPGWENDLHNEVRSSADGAFME